MWSHVTQAPLSLAPIPQSLSPLSAQLPKLLLRLSQQALLCHSLQPSSQAFSLVLTPPPPGPFHLPDLPHLPGRGRPQAGSMCEDAVNPPG